MTLAAKIALCALATILPGSTGGIVTASSIGGWYQTLEPPPGNPPNWVFGQVWTLL